MNVGGGELFYKYKSYLRTMTDNTRAQKIAPWEAAGYYLCQVPQSAAGNSFKERREKFLEAKSPKAVYTTESRWFMGPLITDFWQMTSKYKSFKLFQVVSN